MSDDFFDKIGKKVAEKKAAEATKDQASDRNHAFVVDLVPRLVTIAEGYAEKCKELGMNVQVESWSASITFRLRYQNGSVRELVGGPDSDRQNRLSFEDHYPDNDGKRYKSLAMEWFDEENWSDARYESRLKKTIEDFVFHADRFGGI